MRSLAMPWAALAVTLALAYGLISLALWARSSFADGSSADTAWDDPALIAEGRIIFSQRNCDNEFCHGANGNGNMMGIPKGTKLSDSAWFYSDGSYGGIMKVISEGIPSSPMEPWGTRLGDDKLKRVAAYVKSLSKDK